jgi:ribonucleoside-diphosphate reductase alpha chain
MYRKGSPFPGWKALKLAAASHNHRVESVVYDGEEDVYNGTVDDYHNFIIGGWEEMTPGGRQVSRGIVNANCGEVVLEDKETCNICETFPTVGDNWYQACGHAAFYCTTVSLLPTHQPRTNAIVARNRRIGIGIVDFTGWKQKEGVHRVIRMLRHGYQLVRETADLLNDEAGIPHPIRYTTVKPGGTTPKLPGRTSGAGHPTFSYTLRRIRIAKNSPIHPLLVEAAIPYEEDAFDPYTDCFEFPILQGPALPADRISLWEQAFNLVTLQREWADNAVSNTLYFKPKLVLKEVIKKGEEAKLKNYRNEGKKYKIVGDEFQYKVYEYDPNHEEHDVEPVLSMLAPVVKSVSMLPHTPKGVYRQMPEEAITKEEYEKRLKAIKPIDWSKLRGSDGMDEKYCQGDRCEIQL